MGKTKQLLPLGDSTILAQTIDTVRSAGLDEVILVLGHNADKIQSQLPPALLKGFNIVVNQAYLEGMATSLRAGLAAVNPRSFAALIMLGDQPFVRPETLKQIAREDAKIAIPVYQGQRGNPILLHRSLFAEAMNLEGDVGCRAIFSRHLEKIVNVEVEDQGVLLDIDDPETYQRFRK
jgi:molybdenum cofactor cytidylyltransferase